MRPFACCFCVPVVSIAVQRRFSRNAPPLNWVAPTQYHGLTPEAREFAAETDAAYARGEEEPESSSGGGSATRTLIAPVLEAYIPSSAEHMAHGGRHGEFARPREAEPWLFDRRAEQCQRMQLRIAQLIESDEVPLLEKSQQLLELCSDVQSSNLELSALTFQSIFHVLKSYVHLSQGSVDGDAALPLVGGGASQDPTALPEGIAAMMQMYFHMRGTFTAPTPGILEDVMVCLALDPTRNENTMQAATRLILDSNRYSVMPTTTTYASFIKICGVNGLMDLATVQFADAVVKLNLRPDSAMCQAMLEGFNSNGMIEEGLAFLSRIQQVECDTKFVNSAMETLLLSDDSLGAFSLYEAVMRCSRAAVPNSRTFAVLLLVCEKTGLWDRTVSILAEMQRLRIRGDAQTLNLLLKGLMKQKLTQYSYQLYYSMREKHVEVWPQLEAALPPHVQCRGLRYDTATARMKEIAQEKETRGDEAIGPSNSDPAEGHHRVMKPALRERFIVPRSGEHLKRLAATKRLHRVSPEYLRHFLFARGVDTERRGRTLHTSHGHLVRLTHKALFGVYPAATGRLV